MLSRWSVAVAAAVVATGSLIALPASAAEPGGDGTVALRSASGVEAVGVPVTGPDAQPLSSPRVAVQTGHGRVTTAAVPGFEATVTVPDGQMVALEWQGAPVGAVELRAKANGVWGNWVELEADPDSAPDPTSPDASARPSSSVGPVWTGKGTEAVQVKVTSGRLAELQVDVLRTGSSAAPTSAPKVSESGRAAVAMPAIQPRANWGAGPWRCGGSPDTAPLRNAIVHHTASGNDYTQSEVDDVLRGIYYFHTQNLGWCDIAYNVLVDRFGGMWEGRTGSLANTVIGGHAKGFNTGSVGVSVIGNYEGVALPGATFTAIRKVVAWRLGTAGLDPASSVTLESAGSTKYSAGTIVTIPRISAHRDTSLTACPGTGIYPRLPELRLLTASDVSNPGPTTPVAPVGAWAIPGNRQAHVMWPLVSASRPVTAYVVTVSPGGRKILVAGADNRLYVSGLANGVATRFTVASVDSTGIGPGSAPTSTITPTAAAPFSTTDAFVRQVYADFMGRTPTATELSAARSNIDSGRIPRTQFLETLMRSQNWGGYYAPVARLYFAYFQRAPDSSGLTHWVSRHRGGESLSSISSRFASSAEFQATYGTLTNEQFVRLLYVNVLGRQPDSGGLAHWTGKLASGQTRGYVMIGFSESTEHRARLKYQTEVIMLWQGTLRTMPTSARFMITVARLKSGTSLGVLTEELLLDPIYLARIKR